MPRQWCWIMSAVGVCLLTYRGACENLELHCPPLFPNTTTKIVGIVNTGRCPFSAYGLDGAGELLFRLLEDGQAPITLCNVSYGWYPYCTTNKTVSGKHQCKCDYVLRHRYYLELEFFYDESLYAGKTMRLQAVVCPDDIATYKDCVGLRARYTTTGAPHTEPPPTVLVPVSLPPAQASSSNNHVVLGVVLGLIALVVGAVSCVLLKLRHSRRSHPPPPEFVITTPTVVEPEEPPAESQPASPPEVIDETGAKVEIAAPEGKPGTESPDEATESPPESPPESPVSSDVDSD